MRLEVALAKAERIIGDELRRLGWQEADLASRRKRDPEKLQMALRLRKETTLSVETIAARLQLGTPAAFACWRRGAKPAAAPAPRGGSQSEPHMQGRGLTPSTFPKSNRPRSRSTARPSWSTARESHPSRCSKTARAFLPVGHSRTTCSTSST